MAAVPIPEGYKGCSKSYTLPAHQYTTADDASSITILLPGLIPMPEYMYESSSAISPLKLLLGGH